MHLGAGRSAEADVGLRSPTDAPSAEGAVGQRPAVPDASAETAAGEHGTESPAAERQPGDRPPEPSGAGVPTGSGGNGAEPEGTAAKAEEVLRNATSAGGEQDSGAEAATVTASGPGGIKHSPRQAFTGA